MIKKLLAGLLFVGAAFAALPTAGARPPAEEQTPSVNTVCCKSCVAAGGICHPTNFGCFCE